MKSNPMQERRAALDLAIVALDEMRRQYAWSVNGSKIGIGSSDKAKEKYDKINQAIKTLTAMKNEGPLI